MKIVASCQYIGTNYSGFQFQDNALSVQEKIENAISSVTPLSSRVNCAGRTDKGVHALNQIIDFETREDLKDINWKEAINSFLPNDIKINWCCNAPEDFHARYSAHERSYLYVINNSKRESVFLNDYSLNLPYKLDVKAVQQNAQFLVGTHDFSSFRSSKCNASNPVKTINQIIVDANADLITLKITANSFLQNMIRIIVGTLLDASKSKARLSHSILEILNSKDRAMSGKTVSPKGLYFLGAKYASLDIEYADINSFLNLIHG